LANWELYEKRLKIDGNSIRERSINNTIDAINDSFVNSPSYFEVYINGAETTTGVQIVSGSSTGGQSNSNIKNILMKPNDVLNNGDLIKWNNEYWLNMSVENVGGAYLKGKIIKCTQYITINKNSILSEVPIVIESGVRLYSQGQDDNKYITTLSDEIIVYTPASANIEVDDIYTIGRRNYKVKSVQDVLIDGLLVVKMEVTTEDIVIEEHEYSVTILNGEEVSMYATEHSTLQLEIQCKLDGNLIENPEVEYESSDEDCATVDENGLVTIQGTGTSFITVTYGNATATIKIVGVISIVDIFDITIIPADIDMYVNTTQTFTAKVTNNGIDMPYHAVEWSLVNVDGSSNQYCTYVVNDRDITITSKNFINKQIKIKVTLSVDNDVFEERIITFRSIF
jgi:hypothetical protein